MTTENFVRDIVDTFVTAQTIVALHPTLPLYPTHRLASGQYDIRVLEFEYKTTSALLFCFYTKKCLRTV